MEAQLYPIFNKIGSKLKLTWKQIDPFIKSPDPVARAILIYGPDDGLMRTRAKAIGQTVVSDLNDPFNVTVLKNDDIIADPARLMDEASAMSMMGGDRLIRIENATKALTPTLKTYLENPSAHNLVIIEAGNLDSRDALRVLCEKAKNAAALPCYIADSRNLSTTIRNLLAEEGLTASPDAISWLAENLAGDHGRVVSEINKLKIYMGEEKRVELSHVQDACGSGGALVMDDFVFALAGKNAADMLRAFTQLSDEGVPIISMIRALQYHLRRLHITQARMKEGESLDGAIKKLMPRVFFKYEQPFKAQLQNWSMPALATAMQKLSDLEARSKQTGTPVETVSAQAFLSLARMR
jgi:DNA polymerase-3 subunit delta